VDVRDDVLPVDRQGRGRGHPQRHVQYGPVFGDVNVLAPEHRVPVLRHPGLLGELDKQPHGLVGDAVLGVVEVEACRLCGQPLAASLILGEQVAQVPPGNLGVMAL
jgi:hypothetical protein